jgi:predicted amidohydrolase
MLTLAIAQFRPRKGAYDENLCRFGALIQEAGAWPSPPGLILGPEASLTG